MSFPVEAKREKGKGVKGRDGKRTEAKQGHPGSPVAYDAGNRGIQGIGATMTPAGWACPSFPGWRGEASDESQTWDFLESSLLSCKVPAPSSYGTGLRCASSLRLASGAGRSGMQDTKGHLGHFSATRGRRAERRLPSFFPSSPPNPSVVYQNLWKSLWVGGLIRELVRVRVRGVQISPTPRQQPDPYSAGQNGNYGTRGRLSPTAFA